MGDFVGVAILGMFTFVVDSLFLNIHYIIINFSMIDNELKNDGTQFGKDMYACILKKSNCALCLKTLLLIPIPFASI